ncbi:basic phospholipase A2-like isoform X1 [Biomphalaria glabrata]|uniref:Basic phospholipase A2-like isoform X1 n=1 Tax=Biomphalaria glabrata TaxID=6526 RepID=A0A9W3AU05_BIOGL|nr:basic phospholipase A2-like isoform X1 [Biomphalaria glabrata]
MMQWNFIVRATGFWIIPFLVSTVQSRPPSEHHIEKRHLLQMCELISKYTNRSCLEYNNYGCFCGLGNTATHTGVDDVDNCCRLHDQCYGQVHCFWFFPQLVGYSINCTSHADCYCSDSPQYASCAYSTCMCDLTLAQCLAQHQYHSAFKNFDRRHCHLLGL